MARSPRIDSNETWHHVVNRRERRGQLYETAADGSKFLELVGEMHDQYDLRLAAYCLMGNHFHLVATTSTAQLSDAMRDLSSRYTRWFNKKHGLDGPLFKGRFYSRPVREPSDLMGVCRYVHRNPLDIGRDPFQYRWSDLAARRRGGPLPPWLDRSVIPDPVAPYLRFVAQPLSDPLAEAIELPPFLGRPRVREQIDEIRGITEQVVAECQSLETSRGRFTSAVTLALARHTLGLSIGEITEALAVRSTSTCKTRLRRAQTLIRQTSGGDRVVGAVESALAERLPAARRVQRPAMNPLVPDTKRFT